MLPGSKSPWVNRGEAGPALSPLARIARAHGFLEISKVRTVWYPCIDRKTEISSCLPGQKIESATYNTRTWQMTPQLEWGGIQALPFCRVALPVQIR